MSVLRRSVALVVIVCFPQFASAQDRFFSSNGVRLRYIEQGSGEPVILIHGYTNNIERAWIDTGVFANLSKDFHVVAFDMRGHGKSDKPHDANAYGNETAEDVARLMDHLKIPRAHIIGFSQGGRVTVKLLTTHPERFLTATLGASAGFRNWTAADDRAMEIEAAETERGSFRVLILSIAPTDRPTPTDDAIRQRSKVIVDDYGNDPIALAALVRGRYGLAVTDAQMATVRVPTLAVVGSADSRVTEVDALQKVMPSLKVVVVPNATHSAADERGLLRRPEFVNAVREFLAAHHGVGSR